MNDCLRKKASFWSLLQRKAAEPETLTGALDDDSLVAALDITLQQINPEDRALLYAKYFDGEEVKQIAARLSISAKAVESRLTRSRLELRRLLDKNLKDNEREA